MGVYGGFLVGRSTPVRLARTRGTAIHWLRVVQVLLEFHAVLFVGGPDDFAIVDNDAEGELDFVAAAGAFPADHGLASGLLSFPSQENSHTRRRPRA